MKNTTLSPTKKVLLTAFIGSENLGDEAICESLIHDLIEEHIEITAVSKNTEKTERLGVHAVKLCSLGFFKALTNADVVLLGGGGILQDQTSIYNIPYFIIQILLAQLLRKKTMFIAIGAGPIQGIAGKFLISLSMKKINAITVRDTYSYNVLKKLGADEETMHVVTDPAIALSHDNSGELNAIPITFTENDYIVVCLRHWFDLNRFLPVSLSNKFKLSYRGRCSYKNFITTIAQCLDTIIEETSQRAVFFPFYGNRDITVNRDTYETMKHKNKTVLIKEPQHLSTFYHVVKNAQFVISMRLHAAILSAAQHTPSIALSYSIKVREFMKSLGMERFALDLNDLNEESMLALAREIVQNKEVIHSEIKKSVLRLREANRKNIDIILDHVK
jgi:polysaccharide pyruvyl transferase WcaK-like protein